MKVMRYGVMNHGSLKKKSNESRVNKSQVKCKDRLTAHKILEQSQKASFVTGSVREKSDITRAFVVQNWTEQTLLQAHAFLALQRLQNCKRCSSAMHYADVQLN
jgi:hypothetical protein